MHHELPTSQHKRVELFVLFSILSSLCKLILHKVPQNIFCNQSNLINVCKVGKTTLNVLIQNKEEPCEKNLPNTIQNLPIGKYSHVYIGYNDLVLSSFLFISEECVWHPYFGWISQGQIFQSTFNLEQFSFRKTTSYISDIHDK